MIFYAVVNAQPEDGNPLESNFIINFATGNQLKMMNLLLDSRIKPHFFFILMSEKNNKVLNAFEWRAINLKSNNLTGHFTANQPIVRIIIYDLLLICAKMRLLKTRWTGSIVLHWVNQTELSMKIHLISKAQLVVKSMPSRKYKKKITTTKKHAIHAPTVFNSDKGAIYFSMTFTLCIVNKSSLSSPHTLVFTLFLSLCLPYP